MNPSTTNLRAVLLTLAWGPGSLAYMFGEEFGAIFWGILLTILLLTLEFYIYFFRKLNSAPLPNKHPGRTAVIFGLIAIIWGLFQVFFFIFLIPQILIGIGAVTVMGLWAGDLVTHLGKYPNKTVPQKRVFWFKELVVISAMAAGLIIVHYISPFPVTFFLIQIVLGILIAPLLLLPNFAGIQQEDPHPDKIPGKPVSELKNRELLEELKHSSLKRATAAAEEMARREGTLEFLDPLKTRMVRIPKPSFAMPSWQGEQRTELMAQIGKTMSRMVSGNFARFNGDATHIWCEQCRTRAEAVKFHDRKLVRCKSCQGDGHLIQHVVRVEGTPGKGDLKPDETGSLKVNVWDEQKRAVLPAEIDQLRLEAGLNIHYDWFIAAFVNWVKESDLFPGNKIPVIPDPDFKVEKNSQRLLDSISAPVEI